MKMKSITLFLIFILFSCFAYAESDTKMDGGYIKVSKANYIKYMDLIKKQKAQIEILQLIDKSHVRVVEALEKELAVMEENQGIDKNIFNYQVQMCDKKDQHIKWADERIVEYRKEVRKLESSKLSFLERIQNSAFWPLVAILGGCVAANY